MHELPPAVITSLGPRIEKVSIVAEEPIGLGTGAATDRVTRLTVDFSGPHGRQRIAILRKRLAPINWDSRNALLARLDQLPRVLSHGDYSLGNLIELEGDVVALDWATVGWEPVGFDLAHLAVSAGVDPTRAYLDAPPPSVADPALVTLGFKIAVALIGSSRLHWMMASNLQPPDWYADFVWEHRPQHVN